MTAYHLGEVPFLDDIPPFPKDQVKNIIPLDKIPLKNLDDAATQQRLADACKSQGFFQLDLRGCEAGQHLLTSVENLFGFSKKAFVDVPLEEKQATSFFKVKSIHGWKNPGFVDSRDVHKRADRSEMFHIGKDDAIQLVERRRQAEVAYPPMLIQNASSFYNVIAASHRLGLQILEVVSRGLDLNVDRLLASHDFHEPSTDQARLTYTPKVSAETFEAAKEEKDELISLHEHTDFGTLTLLWNQTGGLQIQDASGKWCFVEPQEGCCICNMGDSMVKYTGNRVNSGKHRVVVAPGHQAFADRYSIVYFMRPCDDAVVEDITPTADPNGEKITGRQWVMNKGRTVTAAYGKGEAS